MPIFPFSQESEWKIDALLERDKTMDLLMSLEFYGRPLFTGKHKQALLFFLIIEIFALALKEKSKMNPFYFSWGFRITCCELHKVLCLLCKEGGYSALGNGIPFTERLGAWAGWLTVRAPEKHYPTHCTTKCISWNFLFCRFAIRSIKFSTNLSLSLLSTPFSSRDRMVSSINDLWGEFRPIAMPKPWKSRFSFVNLRYE